MNFAERIKELRTEKGLKQTDLAEAFGITSRQYQNYEYGKQTPDFKTLELIADYFNVSVDFLMGRTNRREVNR